MYISNHNCVASQGVIKDTLHHFSQTFGKQCFKISAKISTTFTRQLRKVLKVLTEINGNFNCSQIWHGKTS